VKKYKSKKRKSVSLTLNSIVISILLLIVLATLTLVFLKFYKKQKENFVYQDNQYSAIQEWENIDYESLKYNFIQNYQLYLRNLEETLNVNINIKEIEEVKNLELYDYLVEKLKRFGKTEEEIKEDLYFIIEYSKKLNVPLVVSTYIYMEEKTPRFKVSSSYAFGPFQIRVGAAKDAKSFLKRKYPSVYQELMNIEEKYKDLCNYNGYSCVGGCSGTRPKPEPWMVVTCKNLNKEQILEVVKLNIAYGIAYIALTKERVEKYLPNLEEDVKWIVTILSYHLGPCFAKVIKKKIEEGTIKTEDLKEGSKLTEIIEYYAKEGRAKYCDGKRIPSNKYSIKYANDFLSFSYKFHSFV